MAKKRIEKLPSGFERLPSGSIRVRVRIKGRQPAVATFPLFGETPQEKNRQKLEAEAWAVRTRSRLMAGTHVSTREAEKTTLADALRQYQERGLTGKESNVRKDKNRIAQILADPISERSIASLQTTDMAVYRDELQQEAINSRGKPLARTTIANKLQLITRALKFVGEKMAGVPDLAGVKMPAASHGRERRVSNSELAALLKNGAEINPILPLMIRFAVSTALRRERILEFRLSDIHDVGRGTKAIKFPREKAIRTKRTGIIPLTQELRRLLAEITSLRRPTDATTDKGVADDEPLFGINGNTFDHQWRRLIKETKVEDLHFHDLRHEATSRLLERGLSVTEVMSITGHSTVEMLDRYSGSSAYRR